MRGKFVLVPFPFTDLSGSKLRPALVLLETGVDVVVAFVSSHVSDRPLGVVLDGRHPDFDASGLKTPSIIRLDKVATLHKRLVRGEVGEAGSVLRKDVNARFTELYHL